MKKPIIAIMYDFDKTLCGQDMQNYGFIENLGMTPAEFWMETTKFGEKNQMDKILAYMYMMLDKANKSNIKLTREYLQSLGPKVDFFEGVETWFTRINKFGEEHGVQIEHYIISSGTKEIIEGCGIAKFFKEIYACEFLYSEDTKEAIWPKMAINYTNKTQYLFRISKGVLDSNDDMRLNTATSEAKRRVLYRNMIYIGDGMTDIPCMKLVKENGGKAIALFQKGQKDKILPLVVDERVNYICLADYQENSSLDKIIKLIIESMSLVNELKRQEKNELNNFIK